MVRIVIYYSTIPSGIDWANQFRETWKPYNWGRYPSWGYLEFSTSNPDLLAAVQEAFDKHIFIRSFTREKMS